MDARIEPSGCTPVVQRPSLQLVTSTGAFAAFCSAPKKATLPQRMYAHWPYIGDWCRQSWR